MFPVEALGMGFDKESSHRIRGPASAVASGVAIDTGAVAGGSTAGGSQAHPALSAV